MREGRKNSDKNLLGVLSQFSLLNFLLIFLNQGEKKKIEDEQQKRGKKREKSNVYFLESKKILQPTEIDEKGR